MAFAMYMNISDIRLKLLPCLLDSIVLFHSPCVGRRSGHRRNACMGGDTRACVSRRLRLSVIALPSVLLALPWNGGTFQHSQALA
jgi:hypothetical protein